MRKLWANVRAHINRKQTVEEANYALEQWVSTGNEQCLCEAIRILEEGRA